jgi:uncharacterized membrane protein YfcA|tara:strand:- start:65 stop:268 length:204 start_codon:yes stop_codon:yes gene_type:complete
MVNQYMEQFGLFPVLIICLAVILYFKRKYKKKENTKEAKRTFKVLFFTSTFLIIVCGFMLVFGRYWF